MRREQVRSGRGFGSAPLRLTSIGPCAMHPALVRAWDWAPLLQSFTAAMAKAGWVVHLLPRGRHRRRGRRMATCRCRPSMCTSCARACTGASEGCMTSPTSSPRRGKAGGRVPRLSRGALAAGGMPRTRAPLCIARGGTARIAAPRGETAGRHGVRAPAGVVGHTALGGGDMGLFGSGCLYVGGAAGGRRAAVHGRPARRREAIPRRQVGPRASCTAQRDRRRSQPQAGNTVGVLRDTLGACLHEMGHVRPAAHASRDHAARLRRLPPCSWRAG